MITGYNTDVRHADAVFHVQTEDKGEGNPFIESLVYVGGRVLAARRSGYSELLEEGKGDREITALMDRQHRTMIAAIRAGRFDEKLAELVDGQPVTAVQATQAEAPPSPSPEAPAPPPPPPAAAASPAAASPAAEPTLDQVILEYLTSEAEQEQLLLLLDEDPELALGRSAALTLHTTSSKTGAAVPGAEVTVRMISTVDEPQNLARGATDEQGSLRLAFEIPELGRGTAALIITASSPIGRAELKQLL